MKNRLIFILLIGIAVIMATGTVSAATGDTYVNATGGNDSNTGDSWDSAYLTIQKGLDNVANAKTVYIASGTYTGTGNTNLEIHSEITDVTIKGSGKDTTILDGGNTDRGLGVGTEDKITIEDLTIQNAKHPTDSANVGGAILNLGELTVNNVNFKDNTANLFGGAIYNKGTLTVLTSEFNGNTAGLGGAIYNEDATATIYSSIFKANAAEYDGGAIYNKRGTVTLTDYSLIQSNTANYLSGGGIYNDYGTCTVTRSKIDGNTAREFGGGIFNSYGTVVVTDNSLIKANTAIYGFGGGIYNDYGTCTVTDSTIEANSAIYDGGGICNIHGTFTVNSSTIKENTANVGNGGGIFNTEGTFTVNSSTIKENTVNGGGGGIFNTEGTFTVNSSTIEENTALIGGGIGSFSSGTMKVIDSTIKANTAQLMGGGIYNDQGTCTVNFNRIADNSPTAIENFAGAVYAEYNWWGSNNPDFITLIGGDVDYSPWLYMTLTLEPTSILVGETFTLTANFNQAYDGSTITPLNPGTGHLPDGTMVAFTHNIGGICKYRERPTLDGVASTTFTGTDAGLATVQAELDNQKIQNTIEIKKTTTQIVSELEEISDDIQDLSVDKFTRNPTQLKKAFSDKFKEVEQLILEGKYQEAIDKLKNDIRAKCDGSLGGNPKNDWITDPETQKELCTMIDALIADLEDLM